MYSIRDKFFNMEIKMDKFIIPQEKTSIIAHFENNEIHELGNIDIPFLSKTAITENGYIVSICFGSKDSRQLKIFDINGKQLFNGKEYKYNSIACKNNVVYLGGQYGKGIGELFALIDFSDINFSIEEINLPIKTFEGKSIDDILIRDDTLFLVDNLMHPKFIFQYDISSPDNPVHISTDKLDNHGTYEHIEKGEINDNWMILFSQCVGRYGISQHISITGNKEFTLSFYVFEPLIPFPFVLNNFVNKSTEKGICDISLIENYLIVLFEDGVKYLNLNDVIDEISKNNFKDEDEVIYLYSNRINKIIKNKFKELIKLTGNTIRNNYEGVKPQIENRLLKVSDKHCLLLSRNKYEILKLPKQRNGKRRNST